MDPALAPPLARLLLVLRDRPRRAAGLQTVMWPDRPFVSAANAAAMAQPVLDVFVVAGFIKWIRPIGTRGGYVLADMNYALPRVRRVR